MPSFPNWTTELRKISPWFISLPCKGKPWFLKTVKVNFLKQGKFENMISFYCLSWADSLFFQQLNRGKSVQLIQIATAFPVQGFQGANHIHWFIDIFNIFFLPGLGRMEKAQKALLGACKSTMPSRAFWAFSKAWQEKDVENTLTRIRDLLSKYMRIYIYIYIYCK